MLQLLAIVIFATVAGTACQRHALQSTVSAKDRLDGLLKEGKRSDFAPAFETQLQIANLPLASAAVDGAAQVPSKLQFNTDLMPLIPTAELDQSVSRFLEEHESLLEVPTSQLRATSQMPARVGESLVVFTFKRYVNNVEVRNAFVQVHLHKRKGDFWSISSVLNQSLGSIEIQSPLTRSTSEAIRLMNARGFESKEQRQVIYPVFKDNRYAFRYAEESTFHFGERLPSIVITWDLETGQTLEAFETKFNAKRRISADVYKETYLSGETLLKPVSFATIGGGSNSVPTDENGVFDDADLNPSEVALNGAIGAIVDYTNLRRAVRIPVSGGEGDITIPRTTPQFAALNAFTTMAETHAYARKYLNGNDTEWLRYRVPVIVNNQAEDCNAYYLPRSRFIELYGESNRCANMALVNMVLAHEWGHGLDDHTGPSNNISDGAFSEGIGDILAAYLYDTAAMSRGFRKGNSAPIRNLDNNATEPPRSEREREVHVRGQIIGGAFWHLREGLIAKHGKTKGHDIASRLFFSHLLITDTYSRSYDSVISIDDEDGNPATKSKNYCIINEAFSRHGLANDDANCVNGEYVDPNSSGDDGNSNPGGEGSGQGGNSGSDSSNPPPGNGNTPDPNGSSQMDRSIKIALLQTINDPNQVQIFAIRDNAAEIEMCRGNFAACKDETRNISATLSAIDKSVAGKALLSSNQSIRMGHELALTFVAKDAEGNILGIRTIVIKKKNP